MLAGLETEFGLGRESESVAASVFGKFGAFGELDRNPTVLLESDVRGLGGGLGSFLGGFLGVLPDEVGCLLGDDT